MARARESVQRSDLPLLEQLALWLGGSAAPGQNKDNPDQANQAVGTHGPHGPHEMQETHGAHDQNALVLFSQLTSPVAAKAIEDTACYRYGRLLSRNEVGADPADFAMSVDAFHEANGVRATRFPNALLTTATHDHKRGEDLLCAARGIE